MTMIFGLRAASAIFRCHAEAVDEGRELAFEALAGDLGLKVGGDAQEEPAGIAIPELGALGDVGAGLVEFRRQPGDDARPVFAGQGDDGGGRHG